MSLLKRYTVSIKLGNTTGYYKKKTFLPSVYKELNSSNHFHQFHITINPYDIEMIKYKEIVKHRVFLHHYIPIR